MIEKILIFALFLAPLIFFHELGHFIFARLFGVRVETFSIGFGPKLLKKKWKDTTYALSLIPLGGYVKMFGEEQIDGSTISEEDKKYSFSHKSKRARFWIIFGGPLANIILAYFLFVALLLTGEKTPEIRFGLIDSTSNAYQAGIRSGDLVKSINGVVINSPTDITFPDSDIIKNLEVERLGASVSLPIEMSVGNFFEELKKSPPALRKPILLDINGKKFGISLTDNYIDAKPFEEIGLVNGAKELYLFDLEKLNNGYVKKINFSSNDLDEFCARLRDQGLYPHDLSVRSITMGDPADRAGIKGGDIIVGYNGQAVASFNSLRDQLQKNDSKSIDLQVIRNGELKTFKLTPIVKEIEGIKLKLIGVMSGAEYQEIKFASTNSKGLFESLYLGLYRTYDATIKTLDGFAKLLTNQVSMKNVGGPIAIAKVASDSFSTSLSYFFQIMAIISINLGLINLFPIPILDGGHIVFIILEAVNRGKLSKRKMEIAQQVGLSILLLLMFVALFNDVTRLF